jgi:hypothetical protein
MQDFDHGGDANNAPTPCLLPARRILRVTPNGVVARQLVEEGRRAEADVELQRSLAFWREVGATRYVREGEALLAASA